MLKAEAECLDKLVVPSTILSNVITQVTMTEIFTVMKTSNFMYVLSVRNLQQTGLYTYGPKNLYIYAC